MTNLIGLCRTATPFTKTGELDENGMREYLELFNEAKIGIHVASGGSGEGHALTKDELRRVYRIAVETCKGKIQVCATTPERHTARAIIEQMKLAIEEKIEVVNLYGPSAWHSYKPTDEEFLAYHDRVLGEIKHPVALAPNPTIGYSPKANLITKIADKYSQIVAIYLAGQEDDSYFIQLRDGLKRKVEIYGVLMGSHQTFSLGAAGLIGGEFALNPMTCRRYIDLYEAKKYDESNQVYLDLRRFYKFTSRWRPANPRWIKMGMKVLKMPGGEGGVREPYMMPSAEEEKIFTEGLLKLRIPEIDAMAKKAGLELPA